MAEGLLRHLGGERFQAHSAGLEATRVHPLAARAMEELGIDISGQHSKTIDDLEEHEFDFVVSTCDEAAEACPSWPGDAQMLHWSFPDPSAAEGAEEERMVIFRAVRDEIKGRVEALVGMAPSASG
jgi:arsenate reductase